VAGAVGMAVAVSGFADEAQPSDYVWEVEAVETVEVVEDISDSLFQNHCYCDCSTWKMVFVAA